MKHADHHRLHRAPYHAPCREQVSVELVALDKFAVSDAEWNDLYINSEEANPCYAPDFVRQIFKISKRNNSAKILTISHTSSELDKRLIGLLPIGNHFVSKPNHPLILSAQYSCYNGSSVPLIRKGYETAAFNTLLDWLETHASSQGVFIFNEFDPRGRVGRTLLSLLEKRQHSWSIGDHFERPVVKLSGADSFEDYCRLIKGRTRQNLRRKSRQLSKLGTITYTFHSGSDIYQALREFTHLEIKGWKGRAGTALIQSPKGKSLAFETLSSDHFGQTRIECLRLNGQPIAMNIYIGLEGYSILFKPTYNEDFAKFSPGALLHFESVRQLYKEQWTKQIDSAVTAKDQLSSIWRQKRSVGRLIFGFSPTTSPISVNSVLAFINLKNRTKTLPRRLFSLLP